MREGVNMAEQKKGGEAQSLQTPSISYDNSNSKGNGKLSNNQIVRNKFSYFNTQSDDYLDNERIALILKEEADNESINLGKNIIKT